MTAIQLHLIVLGQPTPECLEVTAGTTRAKRGGAVQGAMDLGIYYRKAVLGTAAPSEPLSCGLEGRVHFCYKGLVLKLPVPGLGR